MELEVVQDHVKTPETAGRRVVEVRRDVWEGDIDRAVSGIGMDVTADSPEQRSGSRTWKREYEPEGEGMPVVLELAYIRIEGAEIGQGERPGTRGRRTERRAGECQGARGWR